MHIPKYWSEYTLSFHHKSKRSTKNTVTIRRYGWSNESVTSAECMAKQRCEEAKNTLKSGKVIQRIEGKDAYLDKTELPIREEIIEVYPELNAITTVNSYGATCLNVEDVMILDIDNDIIEADFFTKNCHEVPKSISLWWSLLFSILIFIFFYIASLPHSIITGVASFLGLSFLTNFLCEQQKKHFFITHGSHEGVLNKNIDTFLEQNPDFSFNIYKTPKGYRLIALQDTFSPNDEAYDACINNLPVDRLYNNLCKAQQCFRARITAKPWRIKMKSRLPTKYFWQNTCETRSRQHWLETYRNKATKFSACQFIRKAGNNHVNEQVQRFVELHNRLCQSHSNKPLA